LDLNFIANYNFFPCAASQKEHICPRYFDLLAIHIAYSASGSTATHAIALHSRRRLLP
jgi:hypothetical protein